MDTLTDAKDMTINERVRYLRKKILKITQLELGEVCGIGGTAIAKLEKGGSTVTKRNIKTICNAFNVSYDWLVNGIGDIFIENNDSIELLKKDYDLEDNEIRAIKAFLNLNKVERKVLVYYLGKAFGKDGQ